MLNFSFQKFLYAAREVPNRLCLSLNLNVWPTAPLAAKLSLSRFGLRFVKASKWPDFFCQKLRLLQAYCEPDSKSEWWQYPIWMMRFIKQYCRARSGLLLYKMKTKRGVRGRKISSYNRVNSSSSSTDACKYLFMDVINARLKAGSTINEWRSKSSSYFRTAHQVQWVAI